MHVKMKMLKFWDAAETIVLWIFAGTVKLILIWTVLWGIAQTVPDPPPKKKIQNPEAQDELRKIEENAAAKEALRQLRESTMKRDDLAALETELKKIQERTSKLD